MLKTTNSLTGNTTAPMKIPAPTNFNSAKQRIIQPADPMQSLLSKQYTHEIQRQESIQRVTQLKNKLSMLNKEVQDREKENKQLTSDLVSMERSQNINPTDKNSILLEKDMLRKEISQISDSIIAKTEEVRTLNCYYQSLQKEHQELDHTCARLKSKEETYDRVR
jgi:hypothetical protein